MASADLALVNCSVPLGITRRWAANPRAPQCGDGRMRLDTLEKDIDGRPRIFVRDDPALEHQERSRGDPELLRSVAASERLKDCLRCVHPRRPKVDGEHVLRL